MFKNFAEADEFIRENSVRMVDLKFTGLWGRWHHVTLSATESARTQWKAALVLTAQALA